MGLTKYKLGELVEIVDLRNKDVNNQYKEDDVKGISIDKIYLLFCFVSVEISLIKEVGDSIESEESVCFFIVQSLKKS